MICQTFIIKKEKINALQYVQYSPSSFIISNNLTILVTCLLEIFFEIKLNQKVNWKHFYFQIKLIIKFKKTKEENKIKNFL